MSSLFADDDEDDPHLPHSATASALETLQTEQLADVAAVAAAERAILAAMGTPGSSSASIKSSTAVATKVGVEHNLRLLINDQQSGTRLLLSSLPEAHEIAFGAKLDYKALGYSKLKDLLSTMPSLSICGTTAGGSEHLCMPPPPPPRRPASASAQLQRTLRVAAARAVAEAQTGTTLAPEAVHVKQNSRENVYSPSGEQPALAYEEAAKIAATRVATARWWPKKVLAALSVMSEGVTCAQIIKLAKGGCLSS